MTDLVKIHRKVRKLLKFRLSKKWPELVDRAIKDSMTNPSALTDHLNVLSVAESLSDIQGNQLPFLFWFARETIMRHYIDCNKQKEGASSRDGKEDCH